MLSVLRDEGFLDWPAFKVAQTGRRTTDLVASIKRRYLTSKGVKRVNKHKEKWTVVLRGVNITPGTPDWRLSERLEVTTVVGNDRMKKRSRVDANEWMGRIIGQQDGGSFPA